MISKPFYFLLISLGVILFIAATYVSIIDIMVFQKGIIISGLITKVPNSCTTKANVVEIEYKSKEYSLLIPYSTCKENKYAIGDTIQVRAIIGEERTQFPNSDPRVISVVIIIAFGSVFFYFLFNYKYLTTPQSKE